MSHNDRADLKPGQYILENTTRKPVISRCISPQLRNEILERNGYTCQRCGAGPGDADPFNPGRKIRLHIDHIKPLCSFDLTNLEEVKKAFAPENHRWLLAKDNLAKSSEDRKISLKRNKKEVNNENN